MTRTHEHASSRIERVLHDYPTGQLLVAVGYATPAGMAWLDGVTRGRRVALLIGDTLGIERESKRV